MQKADKSSTDTSKSFLVRCDWMSLLLTFVDTWPIGRGLRMSQNETIDSSKLPATRRQALKDSTSAVPPEISKCIGILVACCTWIDCYKYQFGENLFTFYYYKRNAHDLASTFCWKFENVATKQQGQDEIICRDRKRLEIVGKCYLVFTLFRQVVTISGDPFCWFLIFAPSDDPILHLFTKI